MSDWLTDFLAEFKPFAAGVLGVQWPQLNNTVSILTTVQGVQHNFVEMLNGTAGTDWQFVLPGFIIDIGKFTEKPDELGMSVQSQVRAPFSIVYIQELAPGTQNTVNSQIFQLKQAIEARPSTFQTFTRIEQGQIMSNVDCPINKELLGDAEVNVICAGLFYSPGFLIQLY